MKRIIDYFTLIFLFCIAGKAFANKTQDVVVSYDDEDLLHQVIPLFSAGLPTKKSSFLPTIMFRSEKNTDFLVYKRHDVDNPDRLKFNSSVNPKCVNKEWTTLIFIHGWISRDVFLDSLKNGYWARDENNINIIEVDWVKGSNNLAYFPCVNRVVGIGRTVAKFIEFNLANIDLDKLIIVGHSLGAHAAGFAGRFLQQNYKLMAKQIVGLDPAGFRFRGKHQRKLQPNDAREVIVIHTTGTLGHFKPLGTLDIYLNGGRKQPECSLTQSHRYAKRFYENLFKETDPIFGYKYSSFDDVKSGKIPTTGKINLFRGEPLPPNGTLVYVSTKYQHQLIPKHEIDVPEELSSCVGCLSLRFGKKKLTPKEQ